MTLHPVHNLLHAIVMRVYPLSDELAKELVKLESGLSGNLWLAIGVIALLPAICEEVAFRGFILSGFRRMGHKWTAIALSSVFFGAMHVFFQQSILACLLGLVIGFIAVQTGSLLPAVVFHFVHNSLGVLLKPAGEALSDGDHWLHWLMRGESEGGPLYHWGVIAVGLAASAAILYWFHRLPYARTAEETLQEAIEHQSAQWQPS